MNPGNYEDLMKLYLESQEQVAKLRGALEKITNHPGNFRFGVKQKANSSLTLADAFYTIAKEALSSTPEPKMLSELRAARRALSKVTQASWADVRDELKRDTTKALTRLDAFLESPEGMK